MKSHFLEWPSVALDAANHSLLETIASLIFHETFISWLLSYWPLLSFLWWFLFISPPFKHKWAQSLVLKFLTHLSVSEDIPLSVGAFNNIPVLMTIKFMALAWTSFINFHSDSQQLSCKFWNENSMNLPWTEIWSSLLPTFTTVISILRDGSSGLVA